MRKNFFLFLITVLLINFAGCYIKPTDLPIVRKKPNTYFYTKQLYQALSSQPKSSGIILETNLHKELDLTAEGIDTVKSFLKVIKTQNFIDMPNNLPPKPQYRIYLKSDNEKFIINVYNEKYVAVQPWDGVYSMDYIEMTNVYTLYNLYGLCKHFFK